MSLTRYVKRKTEALAYRLIPASRPWVEDGGFVTFRSKGFVAAEGPEDLLARHNYEIGKISEVVGSETFGRSLEIGCGYGRLSPHFSSLSEQHVAIDLNESALEVARTHYPALNFRKANVVDLPFESGAFDFVSTWTVLQHVPPSSIGQALAEISRVSAHGAMLLLCEEGHLTDVPPAWHTHTWHRSVRWYEDHLPQFRLMKHDSFNELGTVVGLAPPGVVMLFRRDPSP